MTLQQRTIAAAILAIYTQPGGVTVATDRATYPLLMLVPDDLRSDLSFAIKPHGKTYSIHREVADAIRTTHNIGN